MAYAGAFELHCEDCSQRSESWRKMHGCNGPSDIPIYEIDGEKYFECPGKLITDEVAMFINLFAMCKISGALPCAGGLLDQTNVFVEASAVVERVIGEVQDAEQEKLKHGRK